MIDAEERRPRPSHDVFGLIVFLVVCLLVSGAGGAVTATSVDTWYQALQKPPFNPPDWIFAPVWTVLYLFMAIAGWRVWRTAPRNSGRLALVVFAVQLGLNFAWSLVFFGTQRVDLALAIVIVLLLAITANTILFWRIDRWAGMLFAPYVLWVAFAVVLNASIWMLN
jgi:tryptophan-rich sensory protein